MKRFVFVILFAWILSACGPTAENIAGQTAFAATATFEALPTATPTITLTHTPTITPTATMTFTPTMTSTPTVTPTATTGRIEGRVFLTDVDKTIIPLSAQITLNSVKIETGAKGYYSFPELEPGQYAMRVVVVISAAVDLPLKYGRGIYDIAVTRPKNPGEVDDTRTGTINLINNLSLTFPSDKFSVDAGDFFQMDIEISLLGCIRCKTPTPTPTPTP
jgi:hypothetical protein